VKWGYPHFFIAVVVTMLSMAPLELSAQTIGMVADDTTASVTVFDADTHAILGTVPITWLGKEVILLPPLPAEPGVRVTPHPAQAIYVLQEVHLSKPERYAASDS
jgi:hypothetical protein